MLGMTMPVAYWPFRALASVSDRPRPSCRRPRTILVSTREMMLMAEFPRVMGTPMDRIRRTSLPLLEGTSSARPRSR